MESTINSRVSELIKALGLSNNAFAKSIGKTSSAINFIVDGRSKPSFDVLEAIFEQYPQLNPAWLVRNQGSMFQLMEISEVANPAPDQYLQDHVKHLEDSFQKLAHQLEVKDKQMEVKDKQMDGMQRTIDYLLGKPKDVIRLTERNIFLRPEMDLQA